MRRPEEEEDRYSYSDYIYPQNMIEAKTQGDELLLYMRELRSTSDAPSPRKLCGFLESSVDTAEETSLSA